MNYALGIKPEKSIDKQGGSYYLADRYRFTKEGAPYGFCTRNWMPVWVFATACRLWLAKLGGEVPASVVVWTSCNLKQVDNPLIIEAQQAVWMSHADRITNQWGLDHFICFVNSPIAVMADLERKRYGLQFHPVRHTPNGNEILRRFVIDICDCQPDWTPQSIIEKSVADIQNQGGTKILSAVSGGWTRALLLP